MGDLHRLRPLAERMEKAADRITVGKLYSVTKKKIPQVDLLIERFSKNLSYMVMLFGKCRSLYSILLG